VQKDSLQQPTARVEAASNPHQSQNFLSHFEPHNLYKNNKYKTIHATILAIFIKMVKIKQFTPLFW